MLLGVFWGSALGQYRVDSWNADNGLPQNSVTGLDRTSDGYIWLTTHDGLARFDGSRFTIFNKSNTPILTNNRLSNAFADKSGRLWFDAEDGAIFYYKDGEFTMAARPGYFPSGERSGFFDDGEGGVLINIGGKSLRFVDGGFQAFHVHGVPENATVIFADEGEFWFCGGDALFAVRNGSVESYPIGEFFHGDVYETGFKDSAGIFWAAFFKDDKFSLLRVKDGRVTNIPLEEPVNHIIEGAGGDLWLSIYTRGLYRIRRPVASSDILPPDAVERVVGIDGISTNASGHLIFDDEGGLWVGSEKGLDRVSRQIVHVYGKADGLLAENIYPVMADRNGVVWAGIWPNSLVRYENGVFRTWVSDETVTITSFFEDRDGRLWYGTIGGLYYRENERSIPFTAQSGFPDGTEFSVITQDGSGRLWFGTSRGLGSYKDGKAEIYTTAEGLPDDYVVALLVDRNGRLWVGTRVGLALLENGKIRSFTVEDGLASNSIRSLYEDAEGTLWIGSYDGGLTRWKNGKFTVYTTADGLSSNGVFCILEDDNGWFWMNSNQGIYRVRRQELDDLAEGKLRTLTSIAYTKKDGLLNIEGNGGRQPAGTRTPDGKLWFPTAEGIAVIDPNTVSLNHVPPPVIIEEVLIERAVVDNKNFRAAIRDREPITLRPGQNNLELKYTALSYINSENLRFRYKLEGLDRDWNDVGTRRTAYYSYLPPGEYTFHVIAANRDGVWNETGASIPVVVLPPFYRTWWFSLLLFAAVVGIVGLGYYLRVRRLKIRAERQEEFTRQLIASQETERGRIAAEMHDGLGQSLAIIKNRAMISLSKPQDESHMIEQLREIAEASTEAIGEVQSIIYDLRPIQLDRLGLTGSIEDMAERIAKMTDLTLDVSIDDIDSVFTKQAENSVYRIVQEGLNNVVKHAKALAVELIVTRATSAVTITLKDDGCGFDAARVNSKAKARGFGLNGMNERARLLGGRAVVESWEGAGTKVTVTLPTDYERNDQDIHRG